MYLEAATVLEGLAQSGRLESEQVQIVSFRDANGAVGKRDSHTHQLHRYPAKMFGRIPSKILDAIYPTAGRVVLDPFCGSGTVLVEALSRQCSAIGCDTNPIAHRISRAKTTPLSRQVLEDRLQLIIERAKRMRRVPTDEQLPPYWFTSAASRALFRIIESIQSSIEDADYRNFFEVTLSSIVRECSLADPTIPPPVRMRQERVERAGPKYQRALSRALDMTGRDVLERFERKATRNIGRLCSFLPVGGARADVRNTSALETGLPDASVDIVITSPPYCGGAQKYTRTFRLELLILGYSNSEITEIDRRDMGTERAILEPLPCIPSLPSDQVRLIELVGERDQRRSKMLIRYLVKLQEFTAELRRVLRINGNAFVCLGTSHFAGLPIDLSACFIALAEDVGLKLVARMMDPIPSRGLLTKRNGSASVIKFDDVLWFR